MLISSILFFQIFCGFDLISPEYIEKGMRGIALSTFEENKIDTIEVEILGKIPNFQIDREVIIAKLKGGIIDEAGVIAGMSGSPVYIDGKLLGAIAYGWPFAKEPICGITPFADMKNMEAGKSVGSSSLTPIKPILTIAGFPASSVSCLGSLPFDFTVSETVLGGETEDITELVPGGVCGITLVSGDGNVSIMGTITEVIGDTVFAFGHSAYATGSSTLPLCGGKTVTCLPSLYTSMKFAAPGNILGKVVFDGSAGIKALVGSKPPMVDCKIKIGDLKRRYKVTSEESIFPVIPPFLILSNWIEKMGQYEVSTVEGGLNIWTNEGEISLPLAVSGEDIQRYLHTWVKEPLVGIQKNKFKGINIDSLSINLTSQPGIKQFYIEELILRKNIFEVGEEINISVVLSRYRDKDTTVVFNFKAPEDPGELTLRVSGREEYISYELGRTPLKFQFDCFREWKDFLNSLPDPNQLILSVYKKDSSVHTDAGEIKSPPPSLKMVMEKGERKIYNDLYPLFKTELKFDGPLQGENSEVVEVRR